MSLSDEIKRYSKEVHTTDMKMSIGEIINIYKDEEICTHCGACTAVCPTEALYIKRPEMQVIFDKEKCSVCELCILTCPSRAIGLFSETPREIA